MLRSQKGKIKLKNWDVLESKTLRICGIHVVDVSDFLLQRGNLCPSQLWERSRLIINVTVGAMVERSTAALRLASSISIRNKYLYDLHLVVSDLAVCEGKYVILNICKLNHDTGMILSVGQCYILTIIGVGSLIVGVVPWESDDAARPVTLAGSWMMSDRTVNGAVKPNGI